MSIRNLLAALLLGLSALAQAEALLVFDSGKKTMYPAAQLLNHPALRHIEVPVDVAYKRPMSYDAVPLVWLLKAHGVLPSDTIQFKALDGFAMSLPAAPLFNQQPEQAQAWLAIEPGDKKWPGLKGEASSLSDYFAIHGIIAPCPAKR